MPSEIIVTAASALQSCIPLVTLSAYVPQWRRLVTTKSSNDISISAWLLWSVTGSFSCFYAIVQFLVTGKGLPLVFSTATSLVFILATVYLILSYRSNQVCAS